jgi:hypothetical protein
MLPPKHFIAAAAITPSGVPAANTLHEYVSEPVASVRSQHEQITVQSNGSGHNADEKA